MDELLQQVPCLPESSAEIPAAAIIGAATIFDWSMVSPKLSAATAMLMRVLAEKPILTLLPFNRSPPEDFMAMVPSIMTGKPTLPAGQGLGHGSIAIRHRVG